MRKNENFIGVGGMLIRDGSVLLVKQGHGDFRGMWLLPGGHVEPGEHLDLAIKREFREETGLNAEPIGIIGVRSKVITPLKTDVYIMFLMKEVDSAAEPKPIDTREILDISFFPEKVISNSDCTVGLVKGLVKQYFSGCYGLLTPPDYVLPNSEHINYRAYIAGCCD